MSVPIPLQVVLTGANGAGTLDITADIRDLQTRWSDPGGYASCQVSLDRPLNLQPSEITYFNALTVFDTRTGQVVWDGRLEDPGRSGGGSDGQVYRLAAVGGQAHTRDVVEPRIYVDSTFAGFNRVENLAPAAETSIIDDPGGSGKDAMVFRFPQGMSVFGNAAAVPPIGTRIVMRNDQLLDSGQMIALVSYSYDFGVTDGNYELEVLFATDVASIRADRRNMNVAGGTGVARMTGPDWYRVEFKYNRYDGGTAVIPNDTYWMSVMDIVQVAARYTRDGILISDGLTYQPYVLAHEVVDDLLGKHLPECEGDHRTIDDNSTYQIKQLTYVNGADVETVLTDLMTLEAGYTWRVWERSSMTATTTTSAAGSGKFQFEWTTVPSHVRYEADITDGYESSGSVGTVYNQVTVRWTEAGGKTRTALVTNPVPMLDDAGIIRGGQLDLGDEVGNVENALRAGEQWLIDRATPVNAGRLRIARPILDLDTGRMVMPWEIRPALIRVKGIQPHPDALNASTRDGISTFRIIGHDFNASDGAATLELDSYPPSLAHLIAELNRPPDPPKRWRPRPPGYRWRH